MVCGMHEANGAMVRMTRDRRKWWLAAHEVSWKWRSACTWDDQAMVCGMHVAKGAMERVMREIDRGARLRCMWHGA
jgi:hypothetical protein